MVTFRSEAFSEIPLPPEVSFDEALSRFDPSTNSFYLLELDQESYMQCGGSHSACTVEIRKADADGIYRSYVVGRNPLVTTPVRVVMSSGGVWVLQSEVLKVADAILLFECFFSAVPLPAIYALRDRQMAPVQPPSGLGGSNEVVDADAQPLVGWVAADDPANEFGIDGYDCAAYVRSQVSTTTSQEVARSFLRGRNSTGAEHSGKLPANAVALDCSMKYELPVPLGEGVVFRAAEMEDKWDVFLQGGRLIFCRSWTGNLEMVAEIDINPFSMVVNRVWVRSEMFEDDAYLPVRQVDYLIRSHVLGRSAPHPVPLSLERNAQDVGDYSFSTFGRNCSFGSFEDTLA